MAEVTECDDHDRAEFWQGTPQDVTGAGMTGEQAEKVTRANPYAKEGDQ